jgi:hypothetical protein
LLYANDKRPTNLPAFFASLTDNGDGTYSLVYYPTLSGTVNLSISSNETEILGSPFTINIKVGGTAPPAFVLWPDVVSSSQFSRDLFLFVQITSSPRRTQPFTAVACHRTQCVPPSGSLTSRYLACQSLCPRTTVSYRSITDDIWIPDHRQV